MIDVSTAVCKSVRALGLSPTRTHTIVDGCSKALSSNGAEFLLGRLKSLQEYYVDPVANPFPEWMSKKRRPDGLLRPKGFLGQLVGTKTKIETIITLIGAVRTSITFREPTKTQMDNFVSSVKSPPIPTTKGLDPLGLEESVPWIERRLKKKWENREFFGPGDVKGVNIPMGIKSLKMRYNKENVPDPGLLFLGWDGSIANAPASGWSFLQEIGYCVPNLSPEQSRVLFNARRKDSYDSGKRHAVVKGKKSRTKVQDKITVYAGTIGFLQKPSGKLRTVGNPNRFLQWENEPLGEVLGDWVNRQPGVYVTCQDKGIEQIQLWLSKKEKLVSADLSSASDTLDYKLVLGPLFRQPGSSLTRKSVDFFDRITKMPWFIGDATARGYIGESISWKQGQTLGLRPSFPILTITNLTAAQNAVLEVDGYIDPENVPYAIVGDDIVIKEKYADAYSRHITSLGGKANPSKSMRNSVQAEFCSRLITSNSVLRLKPRWLETNDVQNILTFQGTGVKPKIKGWIKRMAMRTGAYALKESGLIPGFHPSQAVKLPDKEVVHAYLGLDKEKAVSNATSMQTLFMRGLERKKADLTRHELMTLSAKECALRFERDNPGKDAISWAYMHRTNGRLPKLDTILFESTQFHEIGKMSKHTAHKVKTFYRDICLDQRAVYTTELNVPVIEGSEFSSEDLLDKTANMQSVEPKSSYDYKSDSRVTHESEITRLSSLNRKIDRIEPDIVHDGEKTHIISHVPNSDIDVLIEDKGEDLELSYHGRTTQSDPVSIAKLAVKSKTESSTVKEEENSKTVTLSPKMTPKSRYLLAEDLVRNVEYSSPEEDEDFLPS